MLYAIIFLSILFFGIAFIVTEKNAKTLLSGYNSLTDSEKEKVDLKNYLDFNKKFHIGLAISFLIIGLFLSYFLGENATGIFLGLFPLIAYVFYFWKSKRYYNGVQGRSFTWAAGIMILLILGVAYLFYSGFQEDSLSIYEDYAEISGIYGEKIEFAGIDKVEQVENIPILKLRKNGFALGDIRKGYFKTNEGNTIKLITHKQNTPLILFTMNDGREIYYATRKGNDRKFDQLKKALEQFR